MKSPNTPTARREHGLYFAGLLAVLLLALFWRSLLPGYVHFSNDGPLGQQSTAYLQMPGGLTGVWCDINYVGFSAGTYSLSISTLLHALLNPVAFAKFYPVVALFLLGLGAWTFFQQLRLTPLAAALGGLAAMLNSTFFSTACWGVASQQIALGMVFLAMALIVGGRANTPFLVRWTRLALAGLCLGVNVIEGADVAALSSMLVALFTLFHALTESDGTLAGRAFRGVSRVLVVTVFALFIAVQAVLALVNISISGVSGTAQDAESKAAHWDWATQWSLPKAETFGLLVPGLFGYKMDTPKDMLPALQESYENGLYWGGMGRAPELDRYFDAGSKGPQPSGPGLFMRFTGGGNYCGVLVWVVAAWAFAQSLRRRNSVFPEAHKRMIWFWAAVMLLCLPLSWGRFAPFYAILYQLPYFSTIRNPGKFVIFFSWALVIIFAYGVHALNRRYLVPTGPKGAGLATQFGNWWARVEAFDRKWTYASVGFFVACVGGWLLYAGQKPDLIAYIQKVGFGDADPTHANSAPALAAFSLGQVEWFLVLLAVATGLVLVVLSGYFNGPRTRLGAVLLGGFLVLDLGRANLPWVTHWDYEKKYEVGALNPILQFLRDKPYEHRVAGLPFHSPQGLELFDEVYRIEWTQHHFPYYNIQSLDIVQLPRMPEDMRAYKEALSMRGDAATAPLLTREWQLTNTRYLLGPAGFLDVMNAQLDPSQHRFRILQRFEVLPKPGVTNPTRLEELTAVPKADGNFALFEFTGALPRAKIYTNWQVNTNDAATLKTLADLSFDPAATLLVSTPEPGLPGIATNVNSGGVEYQKYDPKRIVLSAQTTAPSVLLLNDKFDPQWRVTVDGKPAELLRCNFLMRGVYLPSPGQHTVEFSFSLPHRPLYVAMVAFLVGLGLAGFLWASTRRDSPPATEPE